LGQNAGASNSEPYECDVVVAFEDSAIAQLAREAGLTDEVAAADLRRFVSDRVGWHAGGLFTDAELEEYVEPGYTGMKIGSSRSNPLTLLGGSHDGDDFAVDVEEVGNELLLTGVVDFTGQAYREIAASAGVKAEETLVSVTFRFPGKVKDGNGAIDGKDITYRARVGDRLEINATAMARPSYNLPVIIGAGIVSLVAFRKLFHVLGDSGRSSAGSSHGSLGVRSRHGPRMVRDASGPITAFP
jgi:hypothetical protein